MESDLQKATVIFTIELAQVQRANGDKNAPITKGLLTVLYLQSQNIYILHLNDFKYQLSQKIPIFAYLPRGYDHFPSYVLPSGEGYYSLKIIRTAGPEDIQIFEKILHHHSDFSYKNEEKNEHLDQRKIILSEAQDNKENIDIAMNKDGLKRMNSDNVTQGNPWNIKNVGGFFGKKADKKSEQEEISDTTIIQLKHSDTAPPSTFTDQQPQIQKSNYGIAFEIGRTALYGAACAYEGISDAIDYVGAKAGQAAVQVVTSQYGEDAGKHTRRGLYVFGFASKVMGAPKRGAVKLVKMMTKRKSEVLEEKKA